MLAPISIGDDIPHGETFRRVLSALEWFLPDVLGELHPEVAGEFLDGLLPLFARKTGEHEAEILAWCILLRDQRMAPAHIRLQVPPEGDEVTWMEVRFGERSGPGPNAPMKRDPYGVPKVTYRIDPSRWQELDWRYAVTFGTRRSD